MNYLSILYKVLQGYKILETNKKVTLLTFMPILVLLSMWSQGWFTSFNSTTLVHIFLSIWTTAILLIAGLQALLVYIVDYMLKNNRFNQQLSNLPALERVEQSLSWILNLAFVSLTISLVSAFVYLWQQIIYISWQKIAFAIFAWLILATLQLGKKKFGWRGRTAVHWTTASLATLLISYFGSKLIIG